MSRRNLLIWGVPAALYVAFFLWYTSLSGPLTSDEIDHYMGLIEAQETDPDRRAQLRAFMESDTGDDFYMLNALHMKDVPDQIVGVEPGESSSDVMAKYMAYMFPALLMRASHPVVIGPAVSDTMDEHNVAGVSHWSDGALFRYRSRRDMFEVGLNPEFAGRHDFKIAALEKTMAYPIEDRLFLTDPRFLLFFVLMSLAGAINAIAGRR